VFLHRLSLFARRFEVKEIRQNVGVAHSMTDHIKSFDILVGGSCMYVPQKILIIFHGI
jgi:hypothetical protein